MIIYAAKEYFWSEEPDRDYLETTIIALCMTKEKANQYIMDLPISDGWVEGIPNNCDWDCDINNHVRTWYIPDDYVLCAMWFEIEAMEVLE